MSDSEIPDAEHLFRFVPYKKCELRQGVWRIFSDEFKTRGGELSFNRAAVWPVEFQRAICPEAYGLYWITHGQFKRSARPDLGPLEVRPNPLDFDPLLERANPSHADANRELKGPEPRVVRDLASPNVQWPHGWPPPVHALQD